MRYIRTKYGRIFEVLEEDKQFYYIDYPNEVGLALWGKLAKDVIKEADNIEELCDGICAIERNGKLKVPYVGKTTQDLKVIIDLIDKDNYEVYGAIWTDKGLQFVAKMNEKGVFELL